MKAMSDTCIMQSMQLQALLPGKKKTEKIVETAQNQCWKTQNFTIIKKMLNQKKKKKGNLKNR